MDNQISSDPYSFTPDRAGRSKIPSGYSPDKKPPTPIRISTSASGTKGASPLKIKLKGGQKDAFRADKLIFLQ